jgi:hypothetical protein
MNSRGNEAGTAVTQKQAADSRAHVTTPVRVRFRLPTRRLLHGMLALSLLATFTMTGGCAPGDGALSIGMEGMTVCAPHDPHGGELSFTMPLYGTLPEAAGLILDQAGFLETTGLEVTAWLVPWLPQGYGFGWPIPPADYSSPEDQEMVEDQPAEWEARVPIAGAVLSADWSHEPVDDPNQVGWKVLFSLKVTTTEAATGRGLFLKYHNTTGFTSSTQTKTVQVVLAPAGVTCQEAVEALG